MDWTLWRSFAAVMQAGSLTGAAARLDLSQPTLGRHIEALETQTGSRLFERHLRGLRPTATALKLFEQVRHAKQALANAHMIAQGADAELSGTVRITASTVTSHYTLPKILRTLRAEFPGIALELAPTDSAENLLMRESDIAVRMFRPTQLELIAKKIGESPIVCCAHASYLEGAAPITRPEDLYEHELVGLDRSDLLITGARAAGFSFSRDHFAIRCDSQTALWELTKAGLGIGFAQKSLVTSTPGMCEIPLPIDIPPLEVWLTTHKELFTSRRIRVIYDRLYDHLGELLHAEHPRS